MTEYQITQEGFEKETGRQKLKEIFDLAPFFEPRKKRDFPYNVKSDSDKGLPYPVLTCMSAAYGWYAAYYYYNGLAVVRVFNLKTGGEILSSEVEPIYSKDIFSCPFRSEDGGRKLVIQSSGRMRSLDLVEGEPVWKDYETGQSNAKKTGRRKKEDIIGDAVSQKMKEDCKKHMRKWFPRYEYESLGENIDGTFDSFAGRIAFKIFVLFLTPFVYVLMVNRMNNQEFIYTPQIIHTQDYIWLIDAVYRTIHVADVQGNWLCHSQIQEPFAAADAIGDTLFLLSEDSDSIRSFRFTKLSV